MEYWLKLSLKTRTFLVCALLSAVTLAVYWPVVHHDFVNYDDNCYVEDNYLVHAGLTWQGLAWAFGRLHGGSTYWHPVTWVSHMVDCQLFGLKSAGHHFVNLLVHTLNGILVFLLFHRLTRAFWRSALLAALFALHPLQVDTVAWVAERKNLLSAAFFFLTLWAYARYVEAAASSKQCSVVSDQKPKDSGQKTEAGTGRRTLHASRFTFHVSRFYLLALLFCALGLMCKPVLVTLPCVLLLLDFWPLRRAAEMDCWVHRFMDSWKRQRTGTHAVSQQSNNPVIHQFTTGWPRLIWEKLPFLALSAASCLITLASTRALGVMMDASSGLPLEYRLQNALFSYVRYLGKSLWPLHLSVFYPYPDQFPEWRAVACGLLLLSLSGVALGTARSSPYLLVGWFWFLGVLVPFIGLFQGGEQAMADRFAYVPLIGLLLLLVWGTEELTRSWRRQRILLPSAAIAVLTCCAGLSRRQTGYWQNSVTLFSHALTVTGDSARVHSNLGLALAKEGRTEEAIQHFQETLRLNPDHAVAHWALGAARFQQGRFDKAVEHYETALSLQPKFPEALNNLAWIRATHPDPQYRNGAAAVGLAEQACRLTQQQEPFFIGTLAAAYAEAGRFEEAVRTAERAAVAATAAGQPELAAKNRELGKLYRAGKPYHEQGTNTEH